MAAKELAGLFILSSVSGCSITAALPIGTAYLTVLYRSHMTWIELLSFAFATKPGSWELLWHMTLSPITTLPVTALYCFQLRQSGVTENLETVTDIGACHRGLRIDFINSQNLTRRPSPIVSKQKTERKKNPYPKF